MQSSAVSNTNSCEWLAIHVWTGRERSSAQNLSASGYEIFLPVVKQQRRWSDRVKTIERALFEGYLFCRPSTNVYEKIVKTPGVIGIVGTVSYDEVEAIQRVVRFGRDVTATHDIQTGTQVRINVGPLRGIAGTVLRSKNGYRLILSICALQRSVAVEIESEWVNVLSNPTLATELSRRVEV